MADLHDDRHHFDGEIAGFFGQRLAGRRGEEGLHPVQRAAPQGDVLLAAQQLSNHLFGKGGQRLDAFYGTEMSEDMLDDVIITGHTPFLPWFKPALNRR